MANHDADLAHIVCIAQSTGLTSSEKTAQIAQFVNRFQATNEKDLEHIRKAPSTLNGAASELQPEEQFRLITENLQEVLNPEIIKDVLYKQRRPLVIYWGTAPTGRPHCGYFVPMLQIASFLRAGCVVKILLADIHGFLDTHVDFEIVSHRAEYYKFAITSMLMAVGVSVERLHFVLGSSYQKTDRYMTDLLRLCNVVSMHDAVKAGSEVVKQHGDPKLSGLIYPLMQALDEEYLDVDAQFGGVDQRKIFTFAKSYLPQIGYRQRAHLMNAMVPGLAGGKMSASDPNSKIDVLDTPQEVIEKLKKTWAQPKVTDGNGLLSFIQHVLLPAGAIRSKSPRFVVERPEEEPLVSTNIEKVHDDYKSDILTPQLLKGSVARALNELLQPIQDSFKVSKAWQECLEKAYPPPPPEVKKQKKVKDKGSKPVTVPVLDEKTLAHGRVDGHGTDQVNSQPKDAP